MASNTIGGWWLGLNSEGLLSVEVPYDAPCRSQSFASTVEAGMHERRTSVLSTSVFRTAVRSRTEEPNNILSSKSKRIWGWGRPGISPTTDYFQHRLSF